MTAKQKAQFLQQLQVTMTQLGALADQASTLADLFADRGYDSLASDPVVDADLTDFGVTAYELSVAVNLLQNVKKLVNGDATTPNPAARPTVSKWRSI